jgi:hypothetical protein
VAWGEFFSSSLQGKIRHRVIANRQFTLVFVSLGKGVEQFIDKDGLSLVEASENPDPMGKGRLFLVSVSKARPNQGEIRRDGVR